MELEKDRCLKLKYGLEKNNLSIPGNALYSLMYC